MENSGVYSLAALGITTALTGQALTPITGLDGMSSVTLEANFQYGSGGTTCKVKVQTSFDQGTTWRDIAEFDFATAAAVKTANLVANAAAGVSVYADLASEGVTQGMLGDQLRAFVTTTGTYAGTTLSVNASVR
jgi:hypothetical protein